jgi:hypothetical protein
METLEVEKGQSPEQSDPTSWKRAEQPCAQKCDLTSSIDGMTKDQLEARIKVEKSNLATYVEDFVVSQGSVLLLNLKLARALLIVRLLEPEAYVDKIVAQLQKKHEGRYKIPTAKSLCRYSAPLLEWLRRRTPQLKHNKALHLAILAENPKWILEISDADLNQLAAECGNLETLQKLYARKKMTTERKARNQPLKAKKALPREKSTAVKEEVGAEGRVARSQPPRTSATGTSATPTTEKPTVRTLIELFVEVQQTIKILYAANVSLEPAEMDWDETVALFNQARRSQ